MIEVNIYSDIAPSGESVYLSALGMPTAVFSADTLKNIFARHPTEKEFKFNIHCNGGSVSEGLAIYDILRNSGKTIYTNIEGACHSMAVTLLLAAPKQNRTANRNCRALIHQVRAGASDYLTAQEMRNLATDVEREQNAILDIYARRTGCNRARLEQLMREEKQRTAQELLQYGFISKINNYTTNKFTNPKNEKMSNKRKSLLNKLMNLLSNVVNYDFTDADGNTLFSTDADDDTLEVGLPASPDGTFDLPDGRSVTIAEGVITEIVDPAAEEEQTVEAENHRLRNALGQALEQLREDEQTIYNLRSRIKSTHNVKPRMRVPAKQTSHKTVEDYKNELRDIRKGGK